VHVQSAKLRLFGTHIDRSADELLEGGKKRLIDQLPLRGFCNAKIDNFGNDQAVVLSHQHIGRFYVPVNDPFLVRMLYGPADLDKESKTLHRSQLVLVAVISDFEPTDQLHCKIWTALFSRAGIKDFGDVGMVHAGQGLPLSFEPGDYLLSVHSQFDDLE